MPAKPKSKTSAAAEKRTIKAEITSLKKERRKRALAYNIEARRVGKEMAKMNRELGRIAESYLREGGKIDRRIAILEGRLLS